LIIVKFNYFGHLTNMLEMLLHEKFWKLGCGPDDQTPLLSLFVFTRL